MGKTAIGILGCGVISHQYISDIQRLYSDRLDIRAVADVLPDKVKEVSEQYHIANADTVEELLADPEIRIVVNLTPPQFHTEMNRKVLEAGKNLFCEKPFALTLQDAQEILALAKERGLLVGGAPDTFLGSSLSTCRKLLREGWIGKPLYVTANMMNNGPETWHASPFSFYKEGGGPIFDMGGYYITALVSMFGPVKRIQAVSGTGFKERNVYAGPRKGETFPVTTPTFYSAILEMEDGVIVTMNFSFDIWKSSLPLFEVYGTDGTLEVPDPNMHGGVPRVYRKEQTLAKCFGGDDTGNGETFSLPELYQDVGHYVRGIGVADLAKALEEGTQPATGGDWILHTVDVMTGIIKSAAEGKPYVPVTSCEIPAAAKQ